MSERDGRGSQTPWFHLDGRRVQVWIVETHCSDSTISRLFALLSPAEREEAAHFGVARLRSSFVVVRGALRILIGQYLRMDPTEVRFRRSSNGKPYLEHASTVQFNVSHSADLGMLAFAEGCELGIDVEQVRSFPEMADVVARMFSEWERTQLRDLAPAERLTAFFRGWVRKEAYVKAIGDGIPGPMHSFSSLLTRMETRGRVRVARESGEAQVWNLHDVPVPDGYQAALIYGGAPRQVAVASVQIADLTASPPVRRDHEEPGGEDPHEDGDPRPRREGAP